MKKTIEHNGKSMTVTEWARSAGISHSTLDHRLKRGWSMERSLALPANPSFREVRLAFSKTDAARWLDELSPEQAPEIFKPVLTKYIGKNIGMWLRSKHIALFNKWYEEDFKINHKP